MTETISILWEKVREFNFKSHLYSEVADELTKIAQQIEESKGVNDDEN